MYVWSKSRINYKFIFEFDPRDNLDFYEYFEIPVLFVLLLSLAVYLDFGSKLTQHVATAYWPLILMLITAFILFCPLPIAHATSRRWFIASIGRIIASGYYRVEFRDFFLADEMNSLSYSIEQFEFALCAYAHQWTDTDVRLKIAYILIATTTSIYTFTWDVYMDWGLFRFGKRGGGSFGYPFLRQELVYTRPWIYYFAIITDFLGRFSWIARLLPLNINGFILSFTLAFIEVLRRWQWNFFRLENEHLNNCGQFRAIKDIPLPFHIRVEDKSDDEEEYGEEYEEEYDDRDGDRDNKNRRSVRMEELNDEPGFGKNGSTHGNYPSNANMGGPIRSSGSYGSLGIYSNQGTHGLSQVSEEGRDSLETEATHGSEPMTEASSKVTAGTSTQFPEFTDHIGSTHATRASASSSSDRSKTFGFLDPNSRRIRNADNRPGHNRRQWSESNMFSKARSSTFVEAAVAEAGFKNTQREAIESESRKSNKFYDRRDFDSKLIETESKHAWKNLIGPSLLLGGALSMPATMHGLQSMSAGGMESGGGAGLYEQGPLGRRSASHGGGGGGGGGGGNNKPRARAPLRRQATIGEKVRGSIFGKARKDSDDDDDSDEDFNIHAYYDSE
ncbi:hypothetical protein BGW38_002745 [Lunasporangiospora selenospora]|uniref:EXS domain-containing protein n=1 Tax=Lunasporangiospora selenospora TaxID=979761 RepID=A0A9P6KD71_9FUNG|nr:hypothetical protein BGW38_002745 [Lunasporangiospora selenospora]